MDHHDMPAHNDTASKDEKYHENQYKEEDNESIGKFLSLSDQKRLSEIDQEKLKHQDEEADNFSDSNLSYSSSSQKKPPRSSLHNFQKHFVTTLRRNVRIKWDEDDEGYKKAAREIWHVFRTSKKYTKEFVYAVFGQIIKGSVTGTLEKYGLTVILQKFGGEYFQRGQQYLKDKVLQIFRDSSTQKIMYERRIKKKKQFASYFYKILAEIEEGSTKKRIPKKRKLLKRNFRNTVPATQPKNTA